MARLGYPHLVSPWCMTGRDGDGFRPPATSTVRVDSTLLSQSPQVTSLLPLSLFLGDSWRSRVQYVVTTLNLAVSADVCRLCTAPGSFTTNVRV